MAAHLADEIVVLDCGKVAEQGPAEKVLRQPEAEITRHLLAAMPSLHRAVRPPMEP
jgi:peptide/nickel transport system ATP-binding protein